MNLLFISLGCDKNLVDTEKMLGILGKEGYSFVDFCMRVDSESIRDFMKKWNLDWENDSCEKMIQ